MAEWRILQSNTILFPGLILPSLSAIWYEMSKKAAEPLPQPSEKMNPSSLGLRPYLEIIVELCQSLDREGLQQCILALAKQVQPADRQVFLQNFRTLLLKNEHQAVAVSQVEESFLMSEVESLRQEIENRLKSLEKISWDDSGDDDRCQANPNHDRKMLH